MPNLTPPILNMKQAIKYQKKIQQAIPKNDKFEAFITLYLTENTKKNELKEAYSSGAIFAVKLYPAGATTNSSSGVKNIKKIMPILELMSEIGIPLLIHGEVTDKKVDIFDREKAFIDQKLDFICKELPELKITLEHITTKDAVCYVIDANKNLAASITPHHLIFNRNSIFSGGIRPHYFCLPILKREMHRKALVDAATSGHNSFFLGTDTAPHLKKDKESECGCAGIFNATYCISILAQLFDNENKLKNLENFVSVNGAQHYDLKLNDAKIKLFKNNKPLEFKKTLTYDNIEIDIFTPNIPVFWEVYEDKN